MKRFNRHIKALLLSFAVLLTACEKAEPDFFDENTNGAYFDYEYASQFEKTVNFRDYVVGNPQEVTVKINIKLLGYLADEERTLSIKAKSINDYELAEVIIPDIKFSNREYEKEIDITVKRPPTENTTYAVCLYIADDGDLNSSITGKDEFEIYVTEKYEKPDRWTSTVAQYMGEWSKESHKFLANFTNDNYYYNTFYDSKNMIDKHDVMKELNERIVNSVLAGTVTEPIEAGIPVLAAFFPKYNEPYFWKECPKEIGLFYVDKFISLNRMLGVKTIKDIIDIYKSEEAQKCIVDNAKDIHKQDVLYMMNEYYNYSRSGYNFSEHKDALWIELKKGVVYDIRIPYWWEDPDNLGCKAVVEKYFGEYSFKDENGKTNEDKYRFMLTSMMTARGTENFVIAELFPFIANPADYTWSWDDTVGGEEKIKECYKIIKAAYDNAPAGIYKFTFPELDIE